MGEVRILWQPGIALPAIVNRTLPAAFDVKVIVDAFLKIAVLPSPERARVSTDGVLVVELFTTD